MKSKKILLTFNDDVFKAVLRLTPYVLAGRRGASTKQKRIRRKLFGETLNKLLKMYINNEVVETEKEVIFVKRDENGTIRVNRKGIENG
jgi:hypothetical protein